MYNRQLLRVRGFLRPRYRKVMARRASVGLVLFSLLAMQFAPVARAANDLYWDTNGTAPGSGAATGTWGSSVFWNSDPTGGAAGSFTAATGASNDVHFSAGTNGTAGTVTISGAQAADSISFDNNVALTLSGGTSITLGGGAGTAGISVGAGDNAANTISTALILSGATNTFSTAGSGVLSLTGGITGTSNLILNNNSTGAGGITIASGVLNNTGTVTNSGSGTGTTVISANIGAGVTSVVQNSGTSQLILSGANTFGALTIAAGTVSGTTSASAFGAGTITIGDTSGSANATLSGGFVGTFTNAISIASGNSGTAAITSSAASIFSGNVTLNTHALTLSPSASSLTLSGNISGNGNLVLSSTGAGVVTLSGTSINNTGNIINSGTGSAINVISGTIGAGVTGITQSSATSSLSLTGTNGAYVSGINVTAGTLFVTADLSLGALSSVLTLNGGALAQNANVNLAAGRSIKIGVNGGTIKGSGTGNFTITSVISDVAPGAGSVTIVGNSSLLYVPAGANTYTGGTHLAPTAVTVPNNDASGSASTNNLVSGSYGTGTLFFDGGALRASTGTGTVIGNAISITANTTFIAGATKTLTLNGPVVLTGTGATRTLTQLSATDVLFSGIVGDAGGGNGLAVGAGSAGRIVLSGVDTYTGATTINSGSLVLSGAGTINASAAVTAQTGGTFLVQGTKAAPSVTLASTGLTPASSGTLSLVDATANTLTLPNLTLTGTANNANYLSLEIGNASTGDLISLTTSSIGAGGGIINLSALAGGYDGSVVTLITSAGNDLTSGGGFSLGSSNLAGFHLVLNQTPGSITVSGITSALYFKGGTSNSWADGTNFTTDAAGTTIANAIPSAASPVFFYATGATTANLATTLNQSFTIDSLIVLATATNAMSIAPGSPAGTLTLAPTSKGDGIFINSGAGAFTISAPVVVGSDQTWTNNSANTLTISGGISGSGKNVVINGTGAVTISDTTVYSGNTTITNSSFGGGNVTITSGTLNLKANGDGTTAAQTLSYTNNLIVGGSAVTISADRVATPATSKTLAFSSSSLGAGLTITLAGAGDGYFLGFGNTTLNAAAGGTTTIAPNNTLQATIGNVTGTATAGNVDTLNLGGTTTASSFVTGVISDGSGGGTVALTKSNTGTWILNGSGSNTFTGVTTVTGGVLSTSGLILAKTGGAKAISGTLVLFTTATGADINIGSETVTTASTFDDQFNHAAVLDFTNAASHQYFVLMGSNQYIGGLVSAANQNGVVENTEAQANALNSILTIDVASATTYSFVGFLRDKISTGTGTLAITKNGAGTQIFGGNQIIYTGASTINAGRLELNAATAFASPVVFGASSTGTLQIDTATQSIAGLSTIDATDNNAFVQNIAGTSGVLTVNQTGNTTFGGILQNNPNQTTPSTLGLTKTGAGTLLLTNANTYTGGTTATAGVLQFLNPAALPNFTVPGSVVINGGTLGVNAGGAGEWTAGNIDTLLANATKTSGALGIDTTDGNFIYATNLTAALMGGIGINKLGANSLTLSGANTYTGNTTVTAGTLNITGTLIGNSTTTTLAYGNSAGNTIVNVSNDINAFIFTGANNLAAVSVYNQTAGTVTINPPNTDLQYVAANGYGYFNLTGGTLRDTFRFDVTQPTNATATGVAFIGGSGTLNNNNGDWMIIAYNGLGELTVAPGGSLTRVGSTAPFGIVLNKTNAYGVLNVAGGTVDTGTQPIRFGNGTISNTTGFVNLAGGTLSIGTNATLSVGTGATNSAFFNFAGGTLRATATLSAVIPASTANITFTNTIFGSIDNSAVPGAPSYNGGLTVDTNGFAVTFPGALAGATGSGVTQANIVIPSTGNSGYIGAPAVVFSSTGVVAGGTPAAGYAVISGGQVVGIVITDPGTYTAGTTPSITFTGGGGSIAAFATTALNTSNTNANGIASAGLTKNGLGVLTLSGVNTYIGPTAVNGGTLTLANAAAQSLPGNISIASGAVLNAANTAALTLSGSITGAGTFTQTGAGVTTLSGNINLPAGLFDSAGTILITNTTTINSTPITVNGGIFDLGGTTQAAANFTLISGSIIDGTLTTATQSLLKQGPGTLTLATAVNPGTGTAVTINQGLLNTTSNPATTTTLALNFNAAGAPTTFFAVGSTLTLGGPANAITGGGQLSLLGINSGTSTQTFTSTLVDGGASSIVSTIGTSGTVNLNLGTLTRNVAGTVDITLPATGATTVGNPGTGGTLVVDANGTAFATVGGDNWAAYDATTSGKINSALTAGAGGGSLYIAASTAATFSGNADITASFTANAGASVNSIRFNTGALTLTNAGTTTITTGGVLFGSGETTGGIITGGIIVPGAGKELVFIENKAGGTASITSVIADGVGGATTVTYRGNPQGGTTGSAFNVNANNTYTGPTYITLGRVTSATAAITKPFGTGANAIVYIDGTQDGQFYTAQGVIIANPFVIVGTGWNEAGVRRGVIRLDSTAALTPTLTGNITLVGDASIGNNAAINTGYAVLSGNILTSNAQGASSFALTKILTGDLKLSGNNTQTATNIAAGLLNINADAALGVASGPLTFTGAGTLQFQNAITLPSTRSIVLTAAGTFDTSTTTAAATTTIAGIISGAGGLTKAYGTQGFNSNPLVLTGVNTFTGNVLATSGFLTATNSSSFGTGTKTITATVNTSSDSIHLNPSLGSTPLVPIVFGPTFTFVLSNTQVTATNATFAADPTFGTLVNDSGNNVIQGNVTVSSGGGGAVIVANAGSLTILGTIAPNSTGRNLTFRGAGNITASGIISDQSAANYIYVQRDVGAGTTLLSGANTYGGQTQIASGSVQLGNTKGLGYNPVYTVANFNATPFAAGGTFNDSPNTVVYPTGTVLNAGNPTGTGGTLDLNGITAINESIQINGTGAGGNGALINSNVSTTAQIGNSIASLVPSVGTGANSSAVSITGGGGSGLAASVSLGLTTSTFTVATPGAGYSQVATATIAGGSPTTAGTATALMGVTNATFTITGGTTVYSAAPTVTLAGTGLTGATAVAVLSGGTTGTVTGINVTAPGSGLTAAPTVTFAGGTVQTAGTNPTGTGALAGLIVVGVTVAAGAGYTTIPTSLTFGGTATTQATATVNPNTLAIQSVTVTNPGTGYTSAPTVTIPTTSGSIALAATTAGVVLATNSSIGGARNIQIDGAVSGAAGAGLTKVGAGTVTLTAPNTYTGSTTILGGILSVSADINLGAAAGGLNIGAGTLQSTATFATSRLVTVTSSTSAIDVQQSAAGNSVTLNTGLDGAGQLNLLSSVGSGGIVPGTLILNAAAATTYAGGATIVGGTLAIASDDRLGVGAVPGAVPVNIGNGTLATTATNTFARGVNLTNANSAIKAAASTTATLTGAVTGPGSLNANGPGTLVLAPLTSNSYAGNTNISNGTVLLAGTSPTGTNTTALINVNAGGTLAGAAGGPATVQQAIDINNGGLVTPGIPVSPAVAATTVFTTQIGTLTSANGTSVFNNGGRYNWKLGDPTVGDTTVTGNGTLSNTFANGTGPGFNWDVLALSTLSVAADTSTKFTIGLEGSVTLTPGDTYVFPIATAASLGGISGFDPNKFLLDTSGLTVNGGTPGFEFGIALDPNGNGNQIDLTYNAVPEPLSLGLLTFGALALLRRPRRSRPTQLD